MLSSIFSVLKSIGDFFTMLMDIVLELFTGLASFVHSLLQVPDLFRSLFSSSGLPVVFVTGIVGIVAVVVILRIVGRD